MTDWDFLGADAAKLLRTADELRRAREEAERAAASGDRQRMKNALARLLKAKAAAQEWQEGGE